MSTPEAPPQTPTTPVAPDAAAALPDPITPPGAASNGESHGSAEAHSDASAGAEGAADGSTEGAADGPTAGTADEGTAETAAAPGAAGEHKRRRRRRKRKPGAQAAGEGAESASAEATSEAATDDGAGEPTDAEGAAHPSTARGPGSRDRKKERKHGPPRERPPVNAGDIVFGKIVEITDEAIVVDIPGKAHAIFDRRELLLPDDDEPASAPPRGAAVEAPSHEEVSPVSSTEDGAVPSGELGLSPAGAAPGVSEGTASVEGGADPSAAQAGAGAAQEPVAQTALPQGPPIAEIPAPPEPPKEPKVPRVVLEVGADFIAVVHNDGARGGLVVLTHHPHRAERAKPLVEKAFQEKTTVMGLVTGVIKGGVEVDVDGLRAFAPGSHVDLRLGADLSHLVTERLPFFVTEYAKRGRDVVLSRKSIIEDEGKKARAEALARLKMGEDIDGVVRSVVPFGAFVDVGGVEGLVPLQEMSHNRADGPNDVFKVGETTRVRVMKIDERGKIWLSRRATIPDPWQLVAQKYALGTRHTGKVARLQPFGAFIELESGVDGLIHTQDLSIKRIEGPGDVVKVGDSIEVVVSSLDTSQHKIALHPAPEGDFASEPPQKVGPHKVVKARVVAIESGGLVVRVLGVTGRNARGYITSAGTGTPRGTELRKAFHVGQDVEAKVVEVDPRRGEVKLSIKAFSEEQERSAYQQYRQQLKAEARVTFADLIMKKGK